MKKEVFNIFMNVIHPSLRYKEESVEYYFEQVFNTKFSKAQWEEWRNENKSMQQ